MPFAKTSRARKAERSAARTSFAAARRSAGSMTIPSGTIHSSNARAGMTADALRRLLKNVAVALPIAFLSEKGCHSVGNEALRVGNDRGGIDWFGRAGSEVLDVVVQVGAGCRQDRGQSMHGDLHVSQWPSDRILQILSRPAFLT